MFQSDAGSKAVFAKVMVITSKSTSLNPFEEPFLVPGRTLLGSIVEPFPLKVLQWNPKSFYMELKNNILWRLGLTPISRLVDCLVLRLLVDRDCFS